MTSIQRTLDGTMKAGLEWYHKTPAKDRATLFQGFDSLCDATNEFWVVLGNVAVLGMLVLEQKAQEQANNN